MNKAVYKFHFDCGRQGELHGIFIADKEEVNNLVSSGKEIYFGEVLGKHSEVFGPLTTADFTLLTDDAAMVEFCKKNEFEVGFNPVQSAKEG